MSQGTYFRDHWATIEPERLAYYDSFFDLPANALDTLLAPLALADGHTCLDLGCGPGYITAAMAQRIGPTGHVHGLDMNADFLDRARRVAADARVADRCTLHHVTDDRVPLPDDTVDRALAKNVLEYVPDLAATLAEVKRVLRPGGSLVAIDSDWGFLVAEPLSATEISEIVDAARPVYREPNIGRKLRSAFRLAGYDDVVVNVITRPDIKGLVRGVLDNIVNYGVALGRLDPRRAESVRSRLDDALARGEYLVVLPQFVVVGYKPSDR
jgi:SAM-dependent methyltransferase